MLIGLACALLALAGAATAYPPKSCGQISASGKRLVVQTHGPTCSFAKHWVKVYIAHHRGPAGYSCRSYGKYVPADCKAPKKRWFLANPASR
jgi:hypothetical protein